MARKAGQFRGLSNVTKSTEYQSLPPEAPARVVPETELRHVVVRPAQFTEAQEIHHVVAKHSPFTKKWREVYYFKAYFERGTVGVVLVNDKLAGFVMLHHCISPRTYSSVYYLGVAPEYRNLGLGKSLMRWAWNESRHNTYKLTVDEENQNAQKFWAQMGFVTKGSKRVKDGHLVYQMECSRTDARLKGLA